MSFDKSKISIKEATKILKSIYNLDGEISLLDGEIDFNFKVVLNNSKKYLMKISRSSFEQEYVDYQVLLLEHLNKSSKIELPKLVFSTDNKKSSIIQDSHGYNRSVRLMSWVDGRLWSTVNPITKSLRYELGYSCSELSKSLKDFKHPYAVREIEWDIAKSLWVESHLDKFAPEKLKVLKKFIQNFKDNLHLYQKFEKSIIHNDINDNNIIVTNDFLNPSVKSVIDFGDSVFSQTINDLAITCSYGIMNLNDPLSGCLDILKGYNQNRRVKDNELKLLYNLIAMRLVISVTKSSINRYKEPNNKYLLISEKSAWNLLNNWSKIDSEYAYYAFRTACNLDAHPNKKKFSKWVRSKKFSITDLFPKIKKSKFYKLDLSVGSEWIGGRNEIEDLNIFQFKIDKLQKEHCEKIIAGGYLEPRSIYSSNTYEKTGNYGPENRTIHIGLDFWLPPKTLVSAIFDGEVVTAVNDKGHKEYGGLVILKHNIEDLVFYTLYGHNTVESVLKNKIGSKVNKGDVIAEIANYPENGGWAPHLHFQLKS